MDHLPVLGTVGIKQWLHGPDTHSTDHSFLVGRLPGCSNAYIGTGFFLVWQYGKTNSLIQIFIA